MKTIKLLALSAIVFALGACQTAPDPAKFLDAVKGKSGTFQGMPLSFSADGKEISANSTVMYTFVKANSDLEAVYKNLAGTEGRVTLNSDKKGGKVNDGDTFKDVPFTFN